MNKLVLSVDLDEWYHCRWATGSARSMWPDTRSLFQDFYGSDRPSGELIEPTRRILGLFDRHEIRATFFVLGEVASFYPELVREIHERGHEVACHGLRHVDLTELDRDSFASELKQARETLEQLTGAPVKGYRAPNLIVEPWALDVLEELGFMYDSSVCPSRPLSGKYEGYRGAPQNPYRLGHGSVSEPGTRELVELPIPSFPVLRLPAASGIMTRVLGYCWTSIALRSALRNGDAVYYFHPYEWGERPSVPNLTLRNRIFLRRVGPWMERAVERLIRNVEAQFATAQTVARETRESTATGREGRREGLREGSDERQTGNDN